MTEDEMFNLMQEVEDTLVNDTPDKAADALTTLAQSWANAGLDYNSFCDMRQHLVQSAVRRTAPAFIKEKLQIAEELMRKQRDERNNPSKSTTVN